MKTQLRIVAVLLSATCAAGWGLPAQAEGYSLRPAELQQAFAGSGASRFDRLERLSLASPQQAIGGVASDSTRVWDGLLLPPDPDAQRKMAEGRTRETMSLAHMLLGGTTLGLLAGAGVSGVMLVQQNDPSVRWAHQVCVLSGTVAYLADGALMLLAPRPHETVSEDDMSNIVAHRYLFYLHLAGMTSAVLTGLVATRLWGLDPSLDIRRVHPAVGAASVGLIAVSATVMALNF